MPNDATHKWSGLFYKQVKKHWFMWNDIYQEWRKANIDLATVRMSEVQYD